MDDRKGSLLAGALLLFLTSCSREREPSGSSVAAVHTARLSGLPSVVDVSARPQSPAAAACAARMAEVLRSDPLPGAPVVDGQRAQVLARAIGHPSVFLRPPRTTENPEAKALRERLLATDAPGYALYDLYPTIVSSRERARAVLLSEGYLFADSPGFAVALATVVRLEHLFREPEVFIQRGDRILRAERRAAGEGTAYFYADGTEAGGLAQVHLYDRLASDRAALARPIHVDLVPLAAELGFDRVAIHHLTETAIVAELGYSGVWVPSVLAVWGASVRLECEMLAEDTGVQVAAARSLAVRMESVLGVQRDVIRRQIAEQLPFDEPRTEEGQQDGKLRQEWLWAYKQGRTKFEFNEDPYYVFDLQGRPKVPQVCIDFIRDTYERASGSWFRGRDEERAWVRGKLDFRDFAMSNDRSVESFVAFAESQPESFEVWHLEESERVPLYRRGEFFAYLFEHRDRFRPGDVVTIYGLRDDGKMHYHSFFVFSSDPITGMPLQVAANAGRPRIRTWDGEMRNAPFRSIKTRIRPRLSWLESVTTSPLRTSALEAEERDVAPL